MTESPSVDRRSIMRYGSATALAMFALTAVESGLNPAEAARASHTPKPYVPLPDPAKTPVPNPSFPHHLTDEERRNLKTFDQLDFVIFSTAQWSRMGESHAPNIRVHMPDGSFTDGLDAHIAALKQLFSFAPDTHIDQHPLRVAKNNLTAVMGVMSGTFTQPLITPAGTTPPTGKKYAVDMTTIGIWNERGTMDEEFLFYDNLSFYQQIGLL